MKLLARHKENNCNYSWGIELMIRTRIFLLICTSTTSITLSQTVHFEKFGLEDGLPSSEFYDLIEDKKGFLWFTSDRGVVRYNYYEFETFGISDGLSNMVNFSFHQDSDSTFWLNGYNGTFTFRNGNKFIPFKFNTELQDFKENTYDWYEINKINDHYIWFVKGSHNSLLQYKINRSTGTIHTKETSKLSYSELCSSKTIRLVNFYNFSDKLSKDKLYYNLKTRVYLSGKYEVIIDKNPNYSILNEAIYDDNLWVLTNKGIEIRKQNNLSKKIKEYDLNAAISSVKITRNNEIWATSVSDGIFRIPNPTIELKVFESISNKNIKSIQKFNDIIYVNTFDKKLYEIGDDGNSNLLTSYIPESISNIFFDGEQEIFYFGNIQISGNAVKKRPYGEGTFNPLSDKFALFDAYKLINFSSRNQSKSSFLLEHSIKALAFTFKNNVAYIGDSEGLYAFDFKLYDKKSHKLHVDTIITGMRVI